MYLGRVSVTESDVAFSNLPKAVFGLTALITSSLSIGLGVYGVVAVADIHWQLFFLQLSFVIQSLSFVGLAYLVLAQFQRQLKSAFRSIDARICDLSTATPDNRQGRYAPAPVAYDGFYVDEAIASNSGSVQLFHGRQCRFNHDGTIDLDTLVGFRRFQSLEEAELFIGTEINPRQLLEASR
jgi:hypothetical protein